MDTYSRFAPAEVEERFNLQFIARQMWEEQGFAYSDEPKYGIDDFLFEKIAYHGWEIFCLQPPRANSTIVREFYAHGPSKASTFVHCRGQPVRVDAAAINHFYGLNPTTNTHADFIENITEDDFELMKDDLCYPGTPWETGRHRGSVQRLSLKPEAKLWNNFVKRRLLPSTHNSTINRKRLSLIQSIMNKRTINVGELIIGEIHEYGRKDKGPLAFPNLITGLCTAANVPVDAMDEYTAQRKGWTREFCYKIMHITEAEPVQATSMPGPADTAARASFSAAPQPSPQRTAPIDPYQQIIQRLDAMDLRQQRYMEYQRDFNITLSEMMMQNFPTSNVNFPEFPANMFVTAAPYTETTPAPSGFHPFSGAGPSQPAAAASSANRQQSRRRTHLATPSGSPVMVNSVSSEMDSLLQEFSTAAGPSTHQAWTDPMEVEEDEGTEILPTEVYEEKEDEQGEEVTAPAQRTPPTRVQPSRKAKAQQSPAQKGKFKLSAAKPRKLVLQSSSSSEDI